MSQIVAVRPFIQRFATRDRFRQPPILAFIATFPAQAKARERISARSVSLARIRVAVRRKDVRLTCTAEHFAAKTAGSNAYITRSSNRQPTSNRQPAASRQPAFMNWFSINGRMNASALFYPTKKRALTHIRWIIIDSGALSVPESRWRVASGRRSRPQRGVGRSQMRSDLSG